MKRLSFVRSANHAHAYALRLSLCMICTLLFSLLLPFLAPAASAQTTTGGTVVAWGDNSYGQTNVPAGLSDVTAIAAGNAHSLALKADGTVVAWGNNSNGQMNVPAGLSGVTAIAAGYSHSLALKADGTVVAWGNNSNGQTNVPTGLNDVTAIAAGLTYSLALKHDGTVVAWGDNSYGQTNVPAGLSGVTAIAAGFYHSLALKSDGTVVAWGYNGNRQTNVPTGLNDVTAIVAGAYHNLALKHDGTVVAWGWNDLGQTNVPTGLNGVTAIAAGLAHSLALKADGTVVAWGNNNNGQMNVPTGLSGVTAITAGVEHTLALKANAEPPDTTITAQPATLSNQKTASFTFTSNEANATFACSLDNAAFAACTAPQTYQDLADGSHTFQVRAVDAAGNVDPTPASVTWQMDVTAPTVAASVNQTNPSASATIMLTASDALSGVASTSYTINGGATQMYTAPIVLNAVGTYTISYTSTDNAGNISAVQSQPVTIAPATINHSASVEVITAPSSVVEQTLESNQYIRAFTERQNDTLTQAITVNGTVIPAGTKVNVYYLHADKVGNDNSSALTLSGWVSFDTKVVGVISDGATLLKTQSTLGSPMTAYSTSTDQGIEYGDSVSQTGQNQVNVTFSLWNGSDNVRIITLAQ